MTPPAKLLVGKTHLLPGQLLVTELTFSVPLDYNNPDGLHIHLFGRSARKSEQPIVAMSTQEHLDSIRKKPWMVYLEGGPGAGCPEPQNAPLTKIAVSRGYQVLYLDYRGTGLSTPVTSDLLESKGDAQRQADYLKLFRQDTIVLDLEAVRQMLTSDFPASHRQWSIFGQSFGGFVALTYLSKHPAGLREVFLTGGLAPVGRPAEEVYAATYRKVIERNLAFYDKYPEDAVRVSRIAAFLASREGAVPLPSGGSLTFPRLLTMGQLFGSHGGLDSVHAALVRMAADLEQVGYISRPALVQLEQIVPFDSAPIYAVLHEAIYCSGKGVASRWAAQRVGEKLDRFRWLTLSPSEAARIAAEARGAGPDEPPPFFFSGEMIYPLLFETYPELARIRGAADILANFDGWDELYDEAQLARNNVPVYAVNFTQDMYVEYGLASETAAKVRGIKVFDTSAMYHNGVRARPEELFPQLFRLRDDTID